MRLYKLYHCSELEYIYKKIWIGNLQQSTLGKLITMDCWWDAHIPRCDFGIYVTFPTQELTIQPS